MKIFHIPAFTDNYIWAIEKQGKISVIDPGDANAVLKVLEDQSLTLEDILITHHHYDHTGGINELKKVIQGSVYGPDNLAIEGIDVALREHDQFTTLGYGFDVIETPGHTLDHLLIAVKIMYFFVVIPFFQGVVADCLKAHISNFLIPCKS